MPRGRRGAPRASGGGAPAAPRAQCFPLHACTNARYYPLCAAEATRFATQGQWLAAHTHPASAADSKLWRTAGRRRGAARGRARPGAAPGPASRRLIDDDHPPKTTTQGIGAHTPKRGATRTTTGSTNAADAGLLARLERMNCLATRHTRSRSHTTTICSTVHEQPEETKRTPRHPDSRRANVLHCFHLLQCT